MTSSVRIEDLQRKYEQNSRRYFAPLASELRRAGDARRAVALCEAGVAADPDHLSGHVVLAQALADLGDLAGAERSFGRAVEIDPENIIALRSLGDLARDRGDREAARGWYQHALEADPRDPELATRLTTLDSTAVGPSPSLSLSGDSTMAFAAGEPGDPQSVHAESSVRAADGAATDRGMAESAANLSVAERAESSVREDTAEMPTNHDDAAQSLPLASLPDDELDHELQQQRNAEEFTAGFFASVLEADRAADDSPSLSSESGNVNSLPEAEPATSGLEDGGIAAANVGAADDRSAEGAGDAVFLDDLMEFPSGVESEDRPLITASGQAESEIGAESLALPESISGSEAFADLAGEETESADPRVVESEDWPDGLLGEAEGPVHGESLLESLGESAFQPLTDAMPATTGAFDAGYESELSSESVSGWAAEAASESAAGETSEVASESASELPAGATFDVTSRLTAGAPAEDASELSPELTPDTTAEAVSEPDPELTAQATSYAPSEPVSEFVFDATAEVASESDPELTAQATSDAASEPVFELTEVTASDLVSEPDAELTAEVSPDAASHLVSELPSETTAEGAAGSVSESMAETTSEPMREQTHEAVLESPIGVRDAMSPEPAADVESDASTRSAQPESANSVDAVPASEMSEHQRADEPASAQWREEIPSARSRVEFSTDASDWPQSSVAEWSEALPAETHGDPENAGEPLVDQSSSAQAGASPTAANTHPVDEESSRLPFVTVTMGKLLLQQGFRSDALKLFRQLAIQHPGDSSIRQQVAELEAELHPAGGAGGGQTVGSWLRDLARLRPASGGEERSSVLEGLPASGQDEMAEVAGYSRTDLAAEAQALEENRQPRQGLDIAASGSDLLSSAAAAAASAVSWESVESDPSIDDFLFSDDPMEWGEVMPAPTLSTERVSDITLDELLGRPVSAEDEMAAGALASATMAMQHDQETDAQLAEASAEDPGALEHVLARPSVPVVATTRETGGFSFEQFFQTEPAADGSAGPADAGASPPTAVSQAATSAAGGTGNDEEAAAREADLADFHAWLAGLSKS